MSSLERLEAMLDDAARLQADVEYAKAEDVFAAAVRLADDAYGPYSLPAAQVRNEFAILLKADGQYDRARRLYLEALAIYREHPEPRHIEAVATLHHNLAGIDLVRGEPDRAAEWARTGLWMRRDLLGDEHPHVLADEGNFAPILVAIGAFDEAETLLVRLLDQYVDRLGPDDYEVAVTLTNLGGLAAHRGRWGHAHDHLRRAVEIKSALFGPDHPDLLRTLVNLAVVAEHLGAAGEARSVRAQALRIARIHLSPEHPLRRTVEDW